jgi:hypothetical protein
VSTYQVTLTCDEPSCSSEIRFRMSPASLARHEARERYGWTYRDGDDLCAEHAENGAR